MIADKIEGVGGRGSVVRGVEKKARPVSHCRRVINVRQVEADELDAVIRVGRAPDARDDRVKGRRVALLGVAVLVVDLIEDLPARYVEGVAARVRYTVLVRKAAARVPCEQAPIVSAEESQIRGRRGAAIVAIPGSRSAIARICARRDRKGRGKFR